MGKAEKILISCLAVTALTVAVLAIPRAEETGEYSYSSLPRVRHLFDTVVPGVGAGADGADVSDSLPSPRELLRARERDATFSLMRDYASSSYLDEMVALNDSSISRWPDRGSRPIRIWIEGSSPLESFRGTLPTVVTEAFGVWRSSGQLPLRFEFVSDSASAEMLVRWSQRFTDARVGATKRYRDGKGWLSRAEITLALETSAGDRVDEKYVRAVAIHEVGHALGLDHSPDSTDIMAERNTGVFEPSRADVTTLGLLYRLRPGSLKN